MNIAPISTQNVLKKKEIWKEFAKLNSGKFNIIRTKSKEFHRLQLIYTYKSISLEFHESDTKPLKVHFIIPYEKKNFEFNLAKADTIDKFISKFSRRNVKDISDGLKKDYILNSNNKVISKLILDKPDIINIILCEDITLISGNTKSSELTINIMVNRLVDSVEKLKNIETLSTKIIDALL